MTELARGIRFAVAGPFAAAEGILCDEQPAAPPPPAEGILREDRPFTAAEGISAWNDVRSEEKFLLFGAQRV